MIAVIMCFGFFKKAVMIVLFLATETLSRSPCNKWYELGEQF